MLGSSATLGFYVSSCNMTQNRIPKILKIWEKRLLSCCWQHILHTHVVPELPRVLPWCCISSSNNSNSKHCFIKINCHTWNLFTSLGSGDHGMLSVYIIIRKLILVLVKSSNTIPSDLGTSNILTKHSVLVVSTEGVVVSFPSNPRIHNHCRLFLIWVTYDLVGIWTVMKVELKSRVPRVFKSRDFLAVILEQVIIHAVSEGIQNVLGTCNHTLHYTGRRGGIWMDSTQCSRPVAQ